MSEDEERRIAADLQRLVDRERGKALEIQLGQGGPFELPRCQRFLTAYIRDPRTFEFELETEKGQRVRIPVDVSSLQSMKLLIDHLISTTKPGGTPS